MTYGFRHHHPWTGSIGEPSRSTKAARSREKVSDQILSKERSFFPSPNVWKVKTLSPQSPPHNASKNRFVSRRSKLKSSSSLVMLIPPPTKYMQAWGLGHCSFLLTCSVQRVCVVAIARD